MPTESPRPDVTTTPDDTAPWPYDDRAEQTPAADIEVVRRTLRRLSLVMVAIVTLSAPTFHALTGFRAVRDHARLTAEVTADRLTGQAHAAAEGWRPAADDLRGPRDPHGHPDAGIQLTLLQPTGGVLAVSGTPVDGPAVRFRSSVTVDGRAIAEVMVAASLRPTLLQTALVAAVSALVAAALYLAIELIALRALRRALDHLQTAMRQRDAALVEISKAAAQLGRQNARLKAASDELARARDAALTADRSKSMFLAAMSHEVRTPLNAIIGFSEVMAREIYGPIGHEKYRGYATDIRASGDHLLALIDDVLDLSRVEAGKLVLRREPLEVGEQVDACCRLIHGRADGAGIELQFDAGTGTAMVLGDRVRFRQILLNLLTNAVKFTDRGGVVKVSVGASDPDGITIRVSDSGVGMSASDLERVFRPFEQIGTSRPSEGAGLGLTLTRALVGEHGGTLDIASEPGAGTTVTLTFPRLGASAAVGGDEQVWIGGALSGDTQDGGGT
jgi:signal transduction histidine kinase